MQKEEKHEEKLGKELDIHSDWSVDDNCYAIYISQKEQGIPVYYGNKYFMEDTDPKMMPVGGTVSKNGVESPKIRKYIVESWKRFCGAPSHFGSSAQIEEEIPARTSE